MRATDLFVAVFGRTVEVGDVNEAVRTSGEGVRLLGQETVSKSVSRFVSGG